MNKRDLGQIELNKLVQDKFNPKHYSKVELDIGTQRVFRINDRVIQTKNNYDLEVFNGETGTIAAINKKDRVIVVDYGDKTVEYQSENISELVLAYAITVHKSQGSEFPIVIMPIHSSLDILLSRNIIYTGITRAKDSVVLIGVKEELNKGIYRVDNTIRNSRIIEKVSLKT